MFNVSIPTRIIHYSQDTSATEKEPRNDKFGLQLSMEDLKSAVKLRLSDPHAVPTRYIDTYYKTDTNRPGL